MTVASTAASHCKKAMKFGVSLFVRGFNSSKCKTMAKMTVARIKLLRNKRQVVVRQMRRDIALLLQSGEDATARVRVEHVIREQNIMAANEFLELFCELTVARLQIISKRRECPADLKEGISSLIFAAPRCPDIPELLEIRDIFEKKYGKDFVSAATDLRPDSGVNRTLIDKLSVRTPSGELKLKVMKEIAKEYQVEWDTTESKMELLKPPEELIEGPRTFVSASSLPVKSMPKQFVESNISARSSDIRDRNAMNFLDTTSAAEAAAESAKKAIAAAEAAALLAQKEDSSQGLNASRFYSGKSGVHTLSGNSVGDEYKAPRSMDRQSSENFQCLNRSETMPTEMDSQNVFRRRSYNAHTDIKFDESDCDEETVMRGPRDDIHARQIHRRHSYNNTPSANSDAKFDESDYDEEIEVEEPTGGGINPPPNRPAPQLPSSIKQDGVARIHPKLPDYDSLAARFEALKYYRKPQN